MRFVANSMGGVVVRSMMLEAPLLWERLMASPCSRVLMLGTFFLTVVFDLTVAVQVGLVLACGLFVRRMSSLFSVELVGIQGNVTTYKLYGALFFGAVAKIDVALQAVENGPPGRVLVLDALQLRHAEMPLTPAAVWCAIQGNPITRPDLAIG